jgi:gluconokinase
VSAEQSAAVPKGDAVVIGIDIGTTSTKAVAYDSRGLPGASSSVSYPLHDPAPDQAEQDPDEILGAVYETVAHVVARVDRPIRGMSFSSAMHSLLGLDPTGTPLTPSITWADSRASAQAERLRASPRGLQLHRRTGTPIHPMSPLTKLLWFREQEPKLFEQVRHWVGIKDYVLRQLCGVLVTDHSLASGTGLLDIHQLAWDAEALRLAGVSSEQLPELVPTTAVLPAITPSAAARTGLPRETEVIVGAGDGPLANLGLGAVHPGVAVCSIGTSGAIRVTVEDPSVDPHGGVFCYALTERRWVVGGATNNGGVVLAWAGQALAPDLGDQPEEQLLELAAQVPVGSGGLIMLPYLLSERAPQWSSLPLGAYVGLSREHNRGHLVRAALEGVCQQLALVLQAVRDAGNRVWEVRATGGFARSPMWRQMLADVLGMEIRFTTAHEGSSFGAALLGMQALGLVDSIDVAAELVRVEHTVAPRKPAAAAYASLLPVFAELYGALTPTFTSLRRLAPHLPTAGDLPPGGHA